MNIKRNKDDEIEKRELTWYGRVNRMNQVPSEKRKRSRPRISWRDDLRDKVTAIYNLKRDVILSKIK